MKRYDFDIGDPGVSAGMIESTDGDYVKYDDIITEMAGILKYNKGFRDKIVATTLIYVCNTKEIKELLKEVLEK